MNRYFKIRRPGPVALVFWAVAGAIYVTMIGWTLPHLEAIAGQLVFDLRPFGYSVQEARALLDALGPDGRAFYGSRQIPLDMVFPAAFMMALLATLEWLRSKLAYGRWITLGMWATVIAALADYLENFGIVAMLALSPAVPGALVQAASLASVTKALSTSVSLILVTALVGMWVWGVWTRARKARTS